MQLNTPISIDELTGLIDCSKVIKGPRASNLVMGINEIHSVRKGDLMFVDHPKYYRSSLDSLASFVIIDEEMECPADKVLCICADPFKAYKKIVTHLAPYKPPSHKYTSTRAVIGINTVVAPTAFIADDVKIGKDCIIHPHVTIEGNVTIGDRVVISAGTVIGSDAFYYNRRKKEKRLYECVPSCGSVSIQDDVEIGANSTIDKGVSGDTFIGSGTKIDNLVQIAHEVHIEEDCLIAAQVGIAGHVTFGKRVTVWGKCGFVSGISIADGVTILGSTMVASSIDKKGGTYLGQPAIEANTKRREFVYIRRLPAMWRDIQNLLSR